MAISVVDIFAGPGGLGEGFSSYRTREATDPAFRIGVSAEMEANAARTLRLRAFFRQFPAGEAPASYYDYLAGKADQPWTAATRHQWNTAVSEALQLTLGEPAHDQLLHERVSRIAAKGDPWVLIGGPPCQAYSLVGRARNMGIKGYRPEADHRHFLYKHYLHIISRFQPTAFIMENVKGILSSKVGGSHIFPQILEDLRHPGGRTGKRYRIVPLVVGSDARLLEEHADTDFVVRAEDLGIPQARHRVILFGIDASLRAPEHLIQPGVLKDACVRDAIGAMPRVRSSVTDNQDADWPQLARHILREAATRAYGMHPAVSRELRRLANEAFELGDSGPGGLRVKRQTGEQASMPRHLRSWYFDPKLRLHLNHEARGHMVKDLMRYAFVAAFANVHDRSPRGPLDFPEDLAPDHRNWESGKFLDRFKVQMWSGPSSTVTSHLAKDGHYFIHPDPTQLRSLTVREAARLQTFPDNYFFEGPRGAQFRQVGNAVPPLMARQIAEVVHAAINR